MGWTWVSEDNRTHEHDKPVVASGSTRARKIFDAVLGASVPTVFALVIALLNRIDNLEHYRDLDDYRMGQFQTWRDHGEYRRHFNASIRLAERMADISEELRVCQVRVQAMERSAANGHSHPQAGKGGTK